MTGKAKQVECRHRSSKASLLSQGTASANAVANVEADSEQAAMIDWEQLWKRTMRKNANALTRARRKASRSTL